MRTMVKVNTDGVYLVRTLGRPQLPSLLSHNPHQFLSSFKPTMSDCKHIDGTRFPSRKIVEIGEHLRKGTKLTDASSQSNFLTNFHPDICWSMQIGLELNWIFIAKYITITLIRIWSTFLPKHLCKHELEVLFSLVGDQLVGLDLHLKAVVLRQVVLVAHVLPHQARPDSVWLELFLAELTRPGLLCLFLSVQLVIVVLQHVLVQHVGLAKLALAIQRHCLWRF